MFFDRPPAGMRAVLLHVRAPGAPFDAEVEEFNELVTSAALAPLEVVVAARERPHPGLFVGSGKVEELRGVVADTHADLLIVNHELTPAQQRNLEKSLDVRVLTRTELILHIFADRARTFEGQLQVELAQLQHAQSRLVRGWTHLDRQKGGSTQRGGISVRGGAGETQIELDQRMIRERIKHIRGRLERVHRQRARSRRRRMRARVPTIVLVGYTNAGKSTLFNALTDAGVLAEDRLFATLDPTLRQLDLDGFGEVVLADTVGFIRDLPLDLVDAFKATLEEVAQADLLLHVIDCSAPDVLDVRSQVYQVLDDIGASKVPVIEVFNKIDLAGLFSPSLDGAGPSADEPGKVFVSARDRVGFVELKEAIASHLGVDAFPLEVRLEPSSGKVRAWLYEIGAVLSETAQEDGGASLSVRLDEHRAKQLMAQRGVSLQGSQALHRISLLP